MPNDVSFDYLVCGSLRVFDLERKTEVARSDPDLVAGNPREPDARANSVGERAPEELGRSGGMPALTC